MAKVAKPQVHAAPKSAEGWNALDFEALQLFSPATPINEADLFAGRREQLSRLIDGVAERGRHPVLFGERGVGKSSLVNIFQYFIGPSVSRQLVPIRIQAGPYDNFNTLWRRAFRELYAQVPLNKNNEGHEEWDPKETIHPDDVVREMGRFSLNHMPIIIFDEFDKVPDDGTRKLLSHTIKYFSDAGLVATVAIVGVADDIDALIHEHKSTQRNITEVKMPRMSSDELNQVLDKRIPRLGMKLDGDARWKIISLSRGLPGYVHQLGRDSARQAINRRTLTIMEMDVDEAIKGLVTQSDQTTSEEYSSAVRSNKKNNLYKQVLLACAMAKCDEQGQFAPSDLIEPLSKILGRNVKIANFRDHLNAFCETERGKILVKRGQEWAFRYQFTEPKMQPYVIMRGIADEILSESALSTILSSPEQPRLSNDF